MKLVTVVIPVRKGGNPEVTLASLGEQTFEDFDVVIAHDEVGNANWARNRGFELVKTEYTLFSDDDIDWKPEALQVLLDTLQNDRGASYSYGGYGMGDRIQCTEAFNAHVLLRRNFVSTMALVRTGHFPGFDEDIQRLQDWDVWLTMLERKQVGAYCGQVVFSTQVRKGITHGGHIPYEEALEIVKRKHGLGRN